EGISRWVGGSSPPGMTKHPEASMTSVPERPVPIALMLSPSMRISDLKLRSAATMSPPLIKRDIILPQQHPAASFRSPPPPSAHPPPHLRSFPRGQGSRTCRIPLAILVSCFRGNERTGIRRCRSCSPDHLRLLEHGVHQDIGAGRRPIGLDVLGFVMAHAVYARGEDHRGRCHAGDVASIMPGARDNVAMRVAEMLRGAADGGDAILVEGDRLVIEDLADLVGE